MVKDTRDAPYLHSLELDLPTALDVWRLQYRHVLDVHRHDGEWLFMHYDQAMDGSGLDRLEAALGAKVDRGFADPALKRTPAGGDVPAAIGDTYRELCELASYDTAVARA